MSDTPNTDENTPIEELEGDDLRTALDERYSADELEKQASEREIEGRSSMNKAALVEAIAADMESADDAQAGEGESTRETRGTDTPGAGSTTAPFPDAPVDGSEPETVTSPGEGDPESDATDHASAATVSEDLLDRPRFTAEPTEVETGPNNPTRKAQPGWESADEDD